MELKGINKALAKGSKLRIFRSGGGLRVVRIEKKDKLVAYGEHPNVEDALSHASEDYIFGGRPYSDVYGGDKPHYLTGSASVTSNLDAWIAQGHKMKAWCEGNDFVVELDGYVMFKLPDGMEERIRTTMQNEQWSERGYTFNSKPATHFSGICVATEVIEEPPGRPYSDPWMYQVTKTGRSTDFFEAINRAIEAEEQEL